MARFLKRQMRVVTSCENRIARHHLVRPGDLARAGECDRVSEARAALGGEEVVPAVAPVEVRPFGPAELGPPKDARGRADEALRLRVVLLQDDAVHPRPIRPVVGEHVHEPFPPVVIVEERGVETARVEEDRLGPPLTYIASRHEVVRMVSHRPEHHRLHVGVDEVEETVVEGQARCPDSTQARVAAHVELARPGERSRVKPPVDEIARVVDLHAGEPLEGARGDVVVVAGAADRRVGVEAGKNRVAYNEAVVGHDIMVGSTVRSRNHRLCAVRLDLVRADVLRAESDP